MNKVVSLFLDRLAERFTALLAGVVSSRVEGLHAAAQAEQQSQLEDLARGYDADGKPEVAQALRQRAARLTSCDLAGEAVEVMQRVNAEVPQLPGPHPVNPTRPGSDLRGLPNFESAARPQRKRRGAENSEPSMSTPESVS